MSVHISRLVPHLERAGIDWCVYNPSGPTSVPGRVESVARQRYLWYLRYLLTSREPVVFIHTGSWQVWAASAMLSLVRRKRVILTFHGAAVLWALDRAGPVQRAMLLAALRGAWHLIAVNDRIASRLRACGVSADRITVAPAYIDPPDEPLAGSWVPSHVLGFCNAHEPVVLGSGSAVRIDGTDLYGVDLTIELVERLARRFPRVGLVWVLMKIIGFEESYEAELAQRVIRRGLSDRFLFVEPCGELHPLLRRVDLLVRPTASDGDALTIREALAAAVPVVASDVVPRPGGSVVFRTRDIDDLEGAVVATLDDLDGARRRAALAPRESGLEAVLGVVTRALTDA